MNRKYIKEEEMLKGFGRKDKIRIGVTGIGRGTGATTLAVLIAKRLSDNGKRVAYAELGNPKDMNSLIYDKLAMGKRFSKEGFNDAYNLIQENKSIRNLKNVSEGINWALITPKNVSDKIEIKTEDALRLISNLSGEIVIVDISIGYEKLLNEVDYMIAVIDPQPGVLLANEEKLDKLYERGLMKSDVIWVINKFNSGVKSGELNGFLKLKKYHKIKYFSPELRYRDEYNCKIMKPDDELKEALCDIIFDMGISIRHNK